MDYFIIFIIIFTIILILFFNNCISLPILLSFPLLGIFHIFNKNTYKCGGTTNKLRKITDFSKCIIPKGGAESEDEKEINKLQEENTKIIEIIFNFDSIKDSTDELKVFLNNFKLSNKYFMLKNNNIYYNHHVLDPKILQYLANYYIKNWEHFIPQKARSEQYYKNLVHLQELLKDYKRSERAQDDLLKTYKPMHKDEVQKILNQFNTYLHLLNKNILFSEYLKYYNSYDKYKQNYNKQKYKVDTKQLSYINKIKKFIYDEITEVTVLNDGQSIIKDNILSKYNKILDIKDAIYNKYIPDNLYDFIHEINKIKNDNVLSDIENFIFTTYTNDIDNVNKTIYNLFILYHYNLSQIIKLKKKQLTTNNKKLDNKKSVLDELKSKFAQNKKLIKKLEDFENADLELKDNNKETPIIDQKQEKDYDAIAESENKIIEIEEQLENDKENNGYSFICNNIIKPIIVDMIETYHLTIHSKHTQQADILKTDNNIEYHLIHNIGEKGNKLYENNNEYNEKILKYYDRINYYKVDIVNYLTNDTKRVFTKYVDDKKFNEIVTYKVHKKTDYTVISTIKQNSKNFRYLLYGLISLLYFKLNDIILSYELKKDELNKLIELCKSFQDYSNNTKIDEHQKNYEDLIAKLNIIDCDLTDLYNRTNQEKIEKIKNLKEEVARLKVDYTNNHGKDYDNGSNEESNVNANQVDVVNAELMDAISYSLEQLPQDAQSLGTLKEVQQLGTPQDAQQSSTPQELSTLSIQESPDNFDYNNTGDGTINPETSRQQTARQQTPAENKRRSSNRQMSKLISDDDNTKINTYNKEIDNINNNILKMIRDTNKYFEKNEINKDNGTWYNYFKLINETNEKEILEEDILEKVTQKEYNLFKILYQTKKGYLPSVILKQSKLKSQHKDILHPHFLQMTTTEFRTKLDRGNYSLDGKLADNLGVLNTNDNNITEKFKKVVEICHNTYDINEKIINNNNKYVFNLDNINLFNYKEEYNRLKNKYDNFKDCNTKNQSIVNTKTEFLNNYYIAVDINNITNTTNITDMQNNIANMGLIDPLVCISKSIFSLNLELYTLYLSNLERIEIYKEIVPYEKYFQLSIDELKTEIEKLNRQLQASKQENELLKNQLTAATKALEEKENAMQKQLDDCNKKLQDNKNLILSVNTLVKKIKVTNDSKDTAQLKSEIDEIIINLTINDNDINELVTSLTNIKSSDDNIENIINNKTKISIMTNDAIIRILVAFIQKMKECEEARKKLEAENKVLNINKLSKDQLQQELATTKEALEAEKVKLVNKNQELTEQQRKLAAEKEALEDQQTTLETDLAAKEVDLETKTQELTAKEIELTEQQAKLTTATATLAEQQVKLEAATAALADKKTELETVTTALEKAKTEYAALTEQQKRELETKNQQLATKEEELKTAKTTLAEQQAKLASEKEALEAATTALTDKKAELTKSKEALAYATNALEAEKSALVAATATLADKKTELQTATATLATKEDELKATTTTLAATTATLTATKAELEEQQEALATKKRALETDLAAIKEELQKATTKLEAEKAELENVTQKLEAEKAKLENVTQKLEAENKVLTEQQAKLEDATAALADKKTELETATTKLEDATAALADKKTELETATTKLEAQKAELKEQQEALAAKTQELATTKATLEAQKAALADKERELAALTKALEAEKAALTTTKEALTATKAELKQQQEALTATKAELKQQQEALETKTQELVEQQAKLETKTQELTAKEIELTEQQAKLTTATATLAAKEADLVKSQEALKTKTQELTTTKATLATQEAKLKTEKAALATAKTTLEAQKEALAEQQAKLEAEKEALAEQQAKLEAEKEALAEQQAKLEAEKEALAEQQAKLEAEKAALAEKQAELETEKSANILVLNTIERNLKEYIQSYLNLYKDSNDELIKNFKEQLNNIKDGDLKRPDKIQQNLLIIYTRHDALLNELKLCKSLDSTRLEELNKLIEKIKVEVKINNPKNNLKNNTYDSKLKELNELLDILINDRNRLALENGKLSNEIEKLKQEAKNNETKYKNIIKQLNEDIQRLYNKTPITSSDNIESEIKAIKKLIQDEKEKYDNIINNLRKQLESIQNTCNKEKVKLKQAYEEKEKEFQELNKDRTARILQNKFAMNKNKDTMEKSNNENLKLMEEQKKLKEEQKNLKEEFEEYKSKFTIVSHQLETLQTELDSCKLLLQKCNEEKANLNAKVEELKLEIESNINAIKYLNTNIDQTSDLDLNKSDISKNIEFNVNINLLKDNIYKKNKEFNVNINLLKKQCDEEKKRLQQDYNTKKDQFDFKIRNLTAQLLTKDVISTGKSNAELKLEQDKLKKAFDIYKDKHNTDMFNINDLESKLTNLEQKLQEINKKLNKCTQDLADCTQDLADCNQKNQELQEKITKLETITLAKAPAENKQQVQQSIDNTITLAKINNISNTSENDRIKRLEAENKQLKQTLANVEDKIDVEEVYIYVKEPAQVKPIQKNKVPGDIFRLPGDKPM